MAPRVAEQLIERLRIAANDLPDPEPRFNCRIGWPEDYNALFAGDFEEGGDVPQLLDRAIDSGRLLITGRGGGAKTVTLARIVKRALEQELVAVPIGLKGWSAPDYTHWNSLTQPSERLRYLFNRFAILPIGPADLDAVHPSIARIVLVDGLNEVDSRTGQQIIDAVDEYARVALNTSVVVTDRLVRRDFIRPERWHLALVLPLAPEEIRRILRQAFGGTERYDNAAPGTKELLSTPYFLSEFLRDEFAATTTAGQMHAYFVRHALREDQILPAAEAAYAVYRDSTRSFLLNDFRRVAGEEITNALEAAGTITHRGDIAYFDHHLKHDYLASVYVASAQENWNRTVFNRVSFYASSFDTIAMTMEQIENGVAADLLLRRLYDWNIYAAGYALAEGRESRVSREMYSVILAMFAERRWDIVKATATRAKDTLNLFNTPAAEEFLQTVSLEEVFGVLRRVESRNAWFDEWRALFSRKPSERATEHDMNYLFDQDSVMGWTSSNVLKRLRLSLGQQARLRSAMDNAADVVRWRIIHALGSFPSERNAKLLVSQLEAEPVEVRFGATRSLVEMAACAAPRLALWIFRAMKQRTTLMREYQSVVDEFQRAIFIVEERAPDKWTMLVASVLEQFQREAKTSEERDRWDRAVQNLVSTYGI